jgi:hypothetical protein
VNAYLRIACWIVVGCLLTPVLWDLLMIALGIKNASFCQGMRVLNAESDGLLALGSLLGGLALWIHIFLLPCLPAWWK